MDLKEKESLLKLELLEALVRSQKALTSMLEHTARCISSGPAAPAELEPYMKALVRCQSVLAARVAGLRLTRRSQGHPGKVWLRDGLSVTSSRAAASHRRSRCPGGSSQ